MADNPVIALAAGGTGGHMFPAAELAKEILRRGWKAVLITDERGMQYSGEFEGVEIESVASASPSRSGIFAYFGVLAGMFKARKILKKYGVDAVVGFGGYPAMPTVLAARSKGIFYGLHEQNAVLGRVNRVALNPAKFLALSFKDTSRVAKTRATNVAVTGNPVRKQIVEIGRRGYRKPDANRPFNILVVGGSQGANIFAEVVPEGLGMLSQKERERIRITQQCRKEDLQGVGENYVQKGIQAKVIIFIKDMVRALSRADLIISRAGAGSVTEIAAARRPSILVPLKSAVDDHQTANAQTLAKSGGALMIAQDQFTPKQLARMVSVMMKNPDRLAQLAKSAHQQCVPHPAQNLMVLIERHLLRNVTHEFIGQEGGT